YTEIAGTKDRPQRRIRNLPFLNDGRSDVANRLHVEAVEDEAERAQDEHAHLHGADPVVVDDVGDFDLHASRAWNSHFCLCPFASALLLSAFYLPSRLVSCATSGAGSMRSSAPSFSAVNT